MTKRRVHYVLSTHWDREWYQSFQNFRYQLVHLMDEVLDGWRDGRLRGPFQTDGQAIVIDDYLEIRPERRAQVERYAQEKLLRIGPWYVQPDEFIVSGESLIRNLQMGRKLARSLGTEPSNAGFVCDIFGHCSQLPQILSGFGMQGGFIWRGLNTIQTRHVIWRGADGTTLPCYRFGKSGYCSFAIQVRGAFRPDAVTPDKHDAIMMQHLHEEAACTEVDPILAFDGCDHQEWDQTLYPTLLKHMQDPNGEYEFVHDGLDDYLAEMLPQAARISTTVEGELREPASLPGVIDGQNLIPGVLSSRVWIKQDNTTCQNLLCQWTEPFATLAHMAVGAAYPQGFLDVAWKWLISNHPHDSICGCSIDQVHEDMKYRFSQCRQIADRLTTEATKKLAVSVEGELDENSLRVLVAHPLPRPLNETVEITLALPLTWPTFNEWFGYEPKPAFRIYDAAGQEVPYQRLAQAMHRVKGNEITVSLPLSLPALGYTTLTVRAAEAGTPTRYPEVPGLATSEHSMENEYLGVTIESNGTLTLTDKRNGNVYHRLLTFQDDADIGDGWFHGNAVNDQNYLSSACPADVVLVHNGPQITTFRVRTVMHLPAEFCFDHMVRSEELVDFVIENLVSLRPGVDRVEVETTVHNNAGDHRLRVLFPTDALTDTYTTDTPFDVVERPIALRRDNHLYREPEIEPKPQQTWTAVHDAARGMATISVGLMEAAVRDLPERPIVLTLFRATRRTVNTDGEPQGQLRGDLRFRYWIVPLEGAPDRVRLFGLGQQLGGGLRNVQLLAHDLKGRDAQRVPVTGSLLQVQGQAVLTSLQYVGENVQMRLFNPTSEAVQACVELGTWAKQAFHTYQAVNLDDRPLGTAQAISGGNVSLKLTAKQILTIRLS